MPETILVAIIGGLGMMGTALVGRWRIQVARNGTEHLTHESLKLTLLEWGKEHVETCPNAKVFLEVGRELKTEITGLRTDLREFQEKHMELHLQIARDKP